MAVNTVAQTVQVKVSAAERATMQESDLMERMPDGEGADMVEPESETIRLVSLGHNCGPKLSFKHLGRGAETLPFDWSRTRLEGVLHYMRNDFAGFYDFTTRESVPGIKDMIMYRDRLHSFWHDNPEDSNMMERYKRRCARFQSIDAENKMVLFVRAAVVKSEVRRAGEVLKELRDRFGPYAHLLLMLSHQERASGLATVEGHDGLMLFFLPRGAHKGGYTVYADPIATALARLTGRPSKVIKFPNLGYVEEVATEIRAGLDGLGGLRAFEPDAEDDAAEHLQHSKYKAAAAAAVSVGHNFGVRLALDSLNLAGPLTFPFDSTCTLLDGIIHCLRDNFEKFLDLSQFERLARADGSIAYRGSHHSFWHENLDKQGTIDDYMGRISNFRSLDANKVPLLFVRAAATSSELADAARLLAELKQVVGAKACLLLILDGQTAVQGTATVQDHTDLLLHFLCREGVAMSQEEIEAVYREPITTAISWMQNGSIDAIPFTSLEYAASCTDHDSHGLLGLEGFAAFSEASERAIPAPVGGSPRPSGGTVADASTCPVQRAEKPVNWCALL